MKKVTVKAPGSCGEFIQGVYASQPCLVSCPIDLYSQISITEGPATRMLDSKAVRMLELVFNEYRIPRAEKHHINIALTSDIPIEKGMASSTADIAGLAKGLSAYYDLGMDDRRIAELCVMIEPTDNIMFERLNLFNHVRGEVMMEFNASLRASILIIEFKGAVNTMNFHRQQDGYSSEDTEAFKDALMCFREGLKKADLDQIGRACTESARLNQKILYKPYFDILEKMAGRYGGHGIITGHSGTVIGVLYSDERFDYTGFMEQFLKEVPKRDYDALFLKSVIPGGLHVEIENR